MNGENAPMRDNYFSPWANVDRTRSRPITAEGRINSVIERPEWPCVRAMLIAWCPLTLAMRALDVWVSASDAAMANTRADGSVNSGPVGRIFSGRVKAWHGLGGYSGILPVASYSAFCAS